MSRRPLSDKQQDDAAKETVTHTKLEKPYVQKAHEE